MSLEKYKQKRNFNKTPEPKGNINLNDKNNNIFVVQKHAASHLHYDFRLAFAGVLKSWAVPKGPSYNSNETRLAIQVEDHPLEYAEFEGVIPKKEYGGGIVMLWDMGKWEPLTNPEEGLSHGKLTFNLYGEKLKGTWSLVRSGNRTNWLLIKKKDNYTNSISEEVLLNSLSIKSGYNLEQIAQYNTSEKKSKINNLGKPINAKGIIKPFPINFKPQLAILVDKPPQGEEWIYEVKFDGYRLITEINQGKITLYTRNRNDWTAKFPNIFNDFRELTIESAIIDGEIVALDANGISHFQTLQNVLNKGTLSDMVYYAFDLTYVNGQDLSSLSLTTRKQILNSVLKNANLNNIKFSEHLEGDSSFLLKQACKLKLEGLIAKRKGSTYHNSRTDDWIKIKCKNRQEFVIGGYTNPGGSRNFFGSLLIGYYDKPGQLVYVGRVGTGYTQKSLDYVYQKIRKLEQKECPFYKSKNIPEINNTHWVKPQLICEIEFICWTEENVLRHPSFKGLREDKMANTITKDIPLESSKLSKKQTTKSLIADIQLSHPNKVFFPSIKATKLDLALYYEKHEELILPHYADRLISIFRCPDGANQECFYQKHAENMSETIGCVTVNGKETNLEYMYVKDLSSLIALVQYGGLELHTWGSLVNSIEHPDRIIFDLDPSSEVEFSRVIECAKILRVGLEAIGLVSFVKTSGKKGLHVCLPIEPLHSWIEVKTFAHTVANHMVQLAPEQFITRISKKERSKKILIDYLRNERGATCIGAFSTRATPNGTISTPLHWNELNTLKSAHEYNLITLDKRLSNLKSDPWEKYFTIKQSLRGIQL